MKWACATVAPWGLAAGLLVSFTAAAGNDRIGGHSIREASVVAPLVAAGAFMPPSGRGLPNPSRGIAASSLVDPGAPVRPDLKSAAAPAAFPAVERGAKGDPAGTVVPSLSRQGADLAAPSLVVERDEERLPPTVLMRGSAHPPDLTAERGFSPWRDDRTTTQRATAERSPLAASQGSTGIGRAAGVSPARDGATPTVGRAQVYASSTPAAVDWTPVEVAAAPVSLPPGAGRRGLAGAAQGERPRYVDLIDPDAMARERRCLAEAVYFEARSEPEEGQAAVAQVVLNRVKSGLYPASICGVVYQNRHRYMACQFTFACEGKSLRITEAEPWRRAVAVADSVLKGTTYLEEVGASTHYHADYVRPRWASKLKKMDVIGRHIFYKLRPGQT